MTLDDLYRDWRKYAIDLLENSSQVLLSGVYVLCVKYEDGLLFDPGGGQWLPPVLLKCDNDGFCYCKMHNDGCDGRRQMNLFYTPDKNGWALVGKFIRVED